MQLLHVFDRHILGHIDGFRNSTRQKRLDRGHHFDVAHICDSIVAHTAGKDRQMFVFKVWGTDYGLFDINVIDDVVNLRLFVAKSS